jgi:small subunit ribosomal protein S16
LAASWVAVASWVANDEIIFLQEFSSIPRRPIFTKEKTLVVIRLTRRGAKKKPFYRIVAADSRMPRDGRFLEILGTYDPMLEENGCKVDAEKAMAWIKKGAKPSKTVGSLFKKAGVGA